MARTLEFPRAKALVQDASVRNPELTGAAALQFLERLAIHENEQVRRGEKAANPAREFPLDRFPLSSKTCSRWIQELPKGWWKAEDASPEDFAATARVLRELTASHTMTRLFTQAEAEQVARIARIAPDLPPVTVWALARLAVVLQANGEPMDSLNAWLVFSVPDIPDSGSYPRRQWADLYWQMAGRAFPGLPDFYLDVFEMNRELDPNERMANDGSTES